MLKLVLKIFCYKLISFIVPVAYKCRIFHYVVFPSVADYLL